MKNLTLDERAYLVTGLRFATACFQLIEGIDTERFGALAKQIADIFEKEEQEYYTAVREAGEYPKDKDMSHVFIVD